jgi:hypothetical protein
MTDQTPPDPFKGEPEVAPATSGEPVDWYLEMLGVRPEPRKREPARSQSAEVTFLFDAPAASASTPTPLERPDPTQSVDSAVPEPGAELDDWAPHELAKQIDSRRRVPWSLIVTLVILVTVGIGAWLWAPTFVEEIAVEEGADYHDVMTTMQAELPAIQQSLATATEPATSGIALFALAAQLSRLDAAAREVVTRASRPLPDTFALLPRDALEELEPTRSRMPALGEVGLDIVARIRSTITYRTTLDEFLVYPSLPVRANPTQIIGLNLDLTGTLSLSAGILSELPLDSAFDGHRAQAVGAVEAFQDWQMRYIEALRAEDAVQAAALIDEAHDSRTELFQQLVATLAAIRADVDGPIISLNDDISETIAAIPR